MGRLGIVRVIKINFGNFVVVVGISQEVEINEISHYEVREKRILGLKKGSITVGNKKRIVLIKQVQKNVTNNNIETALDNIDTVKMNFNRIYGILLFVLMEDLDEVLTIRDIRRAVNTFKVDDL